jgi:hypothetical protein
MALPPAERARLIKEAQARGDAYWNEKNKWSDRVFNLAKAGILGTAAGGAGYGVLSGLLPAAAPAWQGPLLANAGPGALPTAATALPTAAAAGTSATGLGTAASPFVLGTTAAAPVGGSAAIPTALGLGTAAAPFVLGNEPTEPDRPYTDADWQGPLQDSPTGTGLGDVDNRPYTDADWQGPLQDTTQPRRRNWWETAGDIGDVLGNAAGGSALERNANNASINQRNAALANIFGTQQNAASRALEARADEQQRLAEINSRATPSTR